MYTPELKQFVAEYKDKIVKVSVTKEPTLVQLRNILLESTQWLNPINPKLAMRFQVVLDDQVCLPKCSKYGCNEFVTIDTVYNKKFNKYCSPVCSRSDKTINKDALTKLSNKDWLYEQRITLEKSYELIGKELGCTEIPVKKWCRIHNIPKVRYNESNPIVKSLLSDKVWLEHQYKVLGKTCDVIAAEIKSSKHTVSSWLHKHDIDITPNNAYDRPFSKTSKGEREVVDYIKSFWTGEVICNHRKLIPGGYEVDVYIPEAKVAIEYNGVYSHLYRPEGKVPAVVKGPNYHLNKTLSCLDQGIHLIQIWSSSWESKNDIWKSVLKVKLGLAERYIHARKCNIIHDLGVYDKNIFLKSNHLQGTDKSKVKLGLEYNGELVAVMTFGVPRYNKNYDWELIRFAVAKYTSIRGAFSKLLKCFRSNHSGSIITYADRMYSSGHVYESNGFKMIHINPPSPWYVPKNTEDLVHRSNLTKNILTNGEPTNLTGDELIIEHGYSVIYDCGTIAYGI